MLHRRALQSKHLAALQGLIILTADLQKSNPRLFPRLRMSDPGLLHDFVADLHVDFSKGRVQGSQFQLGRRVLQLSREGAAIRICSQTALRPELDQKRDEAAVAVLLHSWPMSTALRLRECRNAGIRTRCWHYPVVSGQVSTLVWCCDHEICFMLPQAAPLPTQAKVTCVEQVMAPRGFEGHVLQTPGN